MVRLEFIFKSDGTVTVNGEAALFIDTVSDKAVSFSIQSNFLHANGNFFFAMSYKEHNP